MEDKLTTMIVNETEHDLVMKVGNPNCFVPHAVISSIIHTQHEVLVRFSNQPITVSTKSRVTTEFVGVQGRQRTSSAQRGGHGGQRDGRAHEGARAHARAKQKACEPWLQGNCNWGESCNFVHAHTTAPDVEMKTSLQGHEKAIRAIVLPEGQTQLYTGSQDESVRAWDCGTGQCTNVTPMGGDVGALISAAGRFYVGLPNGVKVWDMATLQQQNLGGPKGQVHSLSVTKEGLLFAGTQDGTILVWQFSPMTNRFEPAASMVGHSGPVVALMLIESRMYSGSMDKTIRGWEVASFQCVQMLAGHTDVVTDLLRWDRNLLSCSLDGTVKIWAANPAGQLELTFSYREEENPADSRSGTLVGALKMCVCTDRAGKPVLLVSYNDNTVRLYDLPTFSERGRLFSKEEVLALQVGPNYVVSGDNSGEVKVWSWVDPVDNSQTELGHRPSARQAGQGGRFTASMGQSVSSRKSVNKY